MERTGKKNPASAPAKNGFELLSSNGGAVRLHHTVAGRLGALSGDGKDMLILAVMSTAIGNFAAIAQTNIKRMLAYLSISHRGFLLLGILAAEGKGYIAGNVLHCGLCAVTLGTFGTIIVLNGRDDPLFITSYGSAKT